MQEPDKIRQDIFREMPPQKKWEESVKLRETAWLLKAAAVKSRHPDWNDSQVYEAVKKIFLYATT